MRSNHKDTKNINVEMPIGVYNRLKQHMKTLGIRTNLSFLEFAMTPETYPPNVHFEFLAIDGEQPHEHRALFVIGNCVYRFNGLEFTLIPETEATTLLTQYEAKEVDKVQPV
jgi:hypothetical protein